MLLEEFVARVFSPSLREDVGDTVRKIVRCFPTNTPYFMCLRLSLQQPNKAGRCAVKPVFSVSRHVFYDTAVFWDKPPRFQFRLRLPYCRISDPNTWSTGF